MEIFEPRLDWRAMGDAAVGLFFVVVAAIVLDEHAGLCDAEHDFPIQALVA